ncbi:phosphoribosylaminoimidazolecarboxamide formyltransferase/IMP cyclohydrolase [Nakamurella sp. UYEF19]
MIALSHPVDRELADVLARVISDGVIAPGYEPGVAATLAGKKAGAFLVLEADPGFVAPPWERRDCHGLVLEQRRDDVPITADLLGGSDLAADAVRDALLGLVTARHTQSNSVVLVKDGAAIGIGAGQQNRVDCVRLAAGKARTWWLRRQPHIRDLPQPAGMRRQEHLNWQIRMAEGELTRTQRDEFAVLFPGVDPDLDGQVRAEWIDRLDQVTLVSDGFLPFRDSIGHAAAVGVRHIVEPGGSTRSGDVSAACREHRIELTRTGLRLFNH